MKYYYYLLSLHVYAAQNTELSKMTRVITASAQATYEYKNDRILSDQSQLKTLEHDELIF